MAADPEADLTDPRDRMVDMLLWETLGKQEPPNLVGRILRQAEVQERSRKLRLVFTVAAAAAMVGLCISGFLWLTRTPPPNVAKEPPKTELKTEEKTLVAKAEENKTPDTLEWSRGNTVETARQTKVAVLGGYVHVEAGENTRLKVEGEEKAEQIFLERGKVTCEVDKKIGTFAVRTPAGMVHVTGTKFQVQVPEPDGDHHAELKPQQFLLEVTEGSVQMAGEWGHEGIQAGSKAGCMVGTVYYRMGDDGVSIRVEGEREPVRFAYGQNGEGRINRDQFSKMMTLPPASKVQLAWRSTKDGAREVRRIIGFEALGPKVREGSFRGVLVDKGEKGDSIRVRNETGIVERFTVHWVGGQPNEGGGLDRKVIEQVKHLNKGDRVNLRWIMEEGLRVISVEKTGEHDKTGDREER